jgi:polyhydroxyalkanoate synthesis regulator phasin
MGLLKTILDAFRKEITGRSGNDEKPSITKTRKFVINEKECNSLEEIPEQYRTFFDKMVEGGSEPNSEGEIKRRFEQVITKLEIDPKTGEKKQVSSVRKVLEGDEALKASQEYRKRIDE